jgi:hypothetical protein
MRREGFHQKFESKTFLNSKAAQQRPVHGCGLAVAFALLTLVGCGTIDAAPDDQPPSNETPSGETTPAVSEFTTEPVTDPTTEPPVKPTTETRPETTTETTAEPEDESKPTPNNKPPKANFPESCMTDSDGDGYYGGSDVLIESQQECYELYTQGQAVGTQNVNSGDCNTDEATVYPRAPELADSLDNDCDGTIDEPVLIHLTGALPDHSFALMKPLAFTVNADKALDYLNGPDAQTLQHSVRISPLDNSEPEWTMDGPILDVSTVWNAADQTITIDAYKDYGLKFNTIYRVWVTLYDADGKELGPESDMHHTVSGGDAAKPNDELTLHRMETVLIGFRELGSYKRGEVGKNGKIEPDGTRYGAKLGGTWCDQFYSWVVTQASEADLTNPDKHLGFKGLNSDMVRKYFRDPLLDGYYTDGSKTTAQTDSSYYDDARGTLGSIYYDPQLGDMRSGQMGDFLLGTSGSSAHVAMFLGYDAKSGKVISLEGNVSNTVIVMRRKWSIQTFIDGAPTKCGAAIGIECDFDRNYWVGLGRLQEMMFHPLSN